jgi:cobalt-zinc-cadmium efflux system membrane fusion protein
MTIRVLLTLLGLSLAACGRPSEPEHAPAQEPSSSEAPHTDAENVIEVDEGMIRDLRITTQRVESRPGGERVTLLGELAVDQRSYAEVGAPVAARVSKVLVNTGDTVQRDQPLAELTSPELGRERAAYLSATTRLALAQAALDRQHALAAEKIVPLREVQEAELALDEARAAVRSSRVAIESFGVELPAAKDDLATSPIFLLRSPVGGAVMERGIVVGQMLDPQKAAFRIGDLSTLWLEVHAFERDAVRIQPGRQARLSFAALPNKDFGGVIALVGRQVEHDSRTVPIRIDVKNPSGVLRPGMSATAAVSIGQSGTPILTVPVASVQRVRNEWCVFLPKDGNHFEIRRIGRGRDLGGEVEILSGLTGNETVVVDGAFLLKAQAEKGEGGHDEH